jgi:GcrA cell cycle regulator
MNKGTGLWTEIKIEQLRELWAAGLTAREIAEQLGHDFTRGAVIGKAWRLRLTPRPSPLGRATGRTIPVPRPPAPPPRPPSALTPLQPAVPARAPPPPPRMRRLQLVQLEPHHCKWPVNDPHLPGFYFCAANALDGEVYCEFHDRVAFARPRQQGG